MSIKDVREKIEQDVINTEAMEAKKMIACTDVMSLVKNWPKSVTEKLQNGCSRIFSDEVMDKWLYDTYNQNPKAKTFRLNIYVRMIYGMIIQDNKCAYCNQIYYAINEPNLIDKTFDDIAITDFHAITNSVNSDNCSVHCENLTPDQVVAIINDSSDSKYKYEVYDNARIAPIVSLSEFTEMITPIRKQIKLGASEYGLNVKKVSKLHITLNQEIPKWCVFNIDVEVENPFLKNK